MSLSPNGLLLVCGIYWRAQRDELSRLALEPSRIHSRHLACTCHRTRTQTSMRVHRTKNMQKRSCAAFAKHCPITRNLTCGHHDSDFPGLPFPMRLVLHISSTCGAGFQVTNKKLERNASNVVVGRIDIYSTHDPLSGSELDDLGLHSCELYTWFNSNACANAHRESCDSGSVHSVAMMVIPNAHFNAASSPCNVLRSVQCIYVPPHGQRVEIRMSC